MKLLILDIDRVVFDTNSFFDYLKNFVKMHGFSWEEVVKRAEREGRKELSGILKIISSKCDVNEVLEKLKAYVLPNANEIIEGARNLGYEVVFLSVGDGYQLKKVENLGAPAIVVSSSKEKLEKLREFAESFEVVYIDDKRGIVEKARELGIKAYQAVWFLDESYKKNALPDALKKPEQILEVLR